MMWTNPAWGGLVGAVALWGFLWIVTQRWKTKVKRTLGDPAVIDRLLDPRTPRRHRIKALFFGGALVLWVAALAGPRWGDTFQNVHRRGVDVVIAVDVSKSMLAEDVAPNRLTQAQRELSLLIGGLQGDRVGLVAFAGEAVLMCPLTLDYGAAKSILELISPDLVPTPGTNLGAAIDRALGAFPGGSRKHKALVLLTDGEDQSGTLAAATARAQEAGLRIFPIGFGSAQGDVIPERNEAGAVVGYKKDKDGQTVVSKLDENALRDVAEKTGGVYSYAGGGTVDVDRVLTDIAAMEKKDLESRVYGQRENRYRWPLLVALILLLLEFLTPEVSGRGFRRKRLSLTALSVLWVGVSPTGANAMGRYPRASELSQRVEDRPTDPFPRFQWGLGLSREGGHAAAAEAFEKAQSLATDPAMQSAAAYNAGNAYFQQGQIEKAVEKYKEALRLVPTDPDTKHNLEMAQRQTQQQKSKSSAPNKDSRSGGSPAEPKDAPAGAAPARPDKMSKEDAERLLEMLAAQERDARKKSPQKGSVPPAGPDW